MARLNIDKLKKIEKHRNTIHDKVVATYTVFDHEGAKYFQIDTYGKEEREMPEKISQSFQFNKQEAIYLVNLLMKEFDIK